MGGMRDSVKGRHPESSDLGRGGIGQALLLAMIAVYSTTALGQQQDAAPPTDTNLFSSPQPLAVSLTLPWAAIVNDEFFFQGPWPAQIEVVEDSGQHLGLPVEVERRGNSRQVICKYPPIKLRFRIEDVEGTLLQGQKSLKLVTHCGDGAEFEQYQALEALAYRIYNQVTDLSFRIRPLSISYLDSDTGKKDGPRFAFLVEDDSDLATRNGLNKIKLPALDPERLSPAEASTLALFQYLIGNTHWALQGRPDDDACCDNLKLLGQEPETGPVHAIPNDFDSSGLVNARYAKPAAGLPIDSVTQRYYQGLCVHNAGLDEARQLFLEREATIRSLVQNDDDLTPVSKTRALDYLGGFFDILRDEDQFKAAIVENCRG